MKNNKEKNISFKKLIFVTLITFVLSVLAFTGFFEQLLLSSGLQYHMSSNDLDIYFAEDNFFFDSLTPDEQYKYLYANKTLEEFSSLINKNYEYSKDIKDCKYWAYIWFMYYIENKDNFDSKLNHEFVTTNNHIYNHFYTDDMYCIADSYQLNCQKITTY